MKYQMKTSPKNEVVETKAPEAPTPELKPFEAYEVFVDVPRVNCRVAPSMTASVAFVFNRGFLGHVVAEATDEDEYKWLNFEGYGWVRAEFTRK